MTAAADKPANFLRVMILLLRATAGSCLPDAPALGRLPASHRSTPRDFPPASPPDGRDSAERSAATLLPATIWSPPGIVRRHRELPPVPVCFYHTGRAKLIQ